MNRAFIRQESRAERKARLEVLARRNKREMRRERVLDAQDVADLLNQEIYR